MTIKYQLFAIAGLASLAACATSETTDAIAPPADFATGEPELTTAVNMREGVFEVSLANQSDTTVCVADGDWPSPDYLGKEATPSGSLHHASNRVYAVVGDQHFPIEDENLGFCDASVPDLQDGHACQMAVKSGQTREAVIPFARFPGLVQASAMGEPKLVYAPAITMCK